MLDQAPASDAAPSSTIFAAASYDVPHPEPLASLPAIFWLYISPPSLLDRETATASFDAAWPRQAAVWKNQSGSTVTLDTSVTRPS